MRISASLICAVMLLASGQVSASQVTDVALSYQDGSAVARIDIKGSVCFTHQTEEATDGKPFRVIVDVLSATHHLPAKVFSSLPECPVQRIRTSQYSVEPERVVRLVFDMENATVYRVDSDDNSITLFFPDKDRREFAGWSSATHAATSKVAQKTALETPDRSIGKALSGQVTESKPSAAELNQAINEDRLSSLVGQPAKKEPVPKVEEQKSIAKTGRQAEGASAASRGRQVQVSEVDKPHGPEYDENLLKPSGSRPVANLSEVAEDRADKPLTVRADQPATKKQEPVPEKQEFPADRKLATRRIGDAAPPESGVTPVGSQRQEPAASGKQVAQSTLDNKKAVLTKEKSPKESAQKKATTAPDEAAVQKKVGEPQDSTAKMKDETEDGDKKSSTSRFRRSPTRPTKIKGTLVAEFPKRLVIKYSAHSYRDPFETLINEAKTYNNPVEKRIPNVEGLELVGTLESQAGANSALFEDKNGYGYILKEGDKVQNGYVLRVEQDRVYFQIFEYGWSRTVALNIDED